MAEVQGKYLMYRGKPLVRSKNAICYGSMDDKYILFMLILTNKTIDTPNPKVKAEVPGSVMVQIQSTDPTKSATERIEKQVVKNSLYEAFDIGIAWLDKLNK
ncbi:MAG: hypothetical protein WCQ72_06760 [Eubacteriales bacterium]